MISTPLFIAFVVALCGISVTLCVAAGERFATREPVQGVLDVGLGIIVAAFAVVVVERGL